MFLYLSQVILPSWHSTRLLHSACFSNITQPLICQNSGRKSRRSSSILRWAGQHTDIEIEIVFCDIQIITELKFQEGARTKVKVCWISNPKLTSLQSRPRPPGSCLDCLTGGRRFMIAARALSAVNHVNQPLIVHPCLPLVLPVVQSEAEQLRSLTSLSVFPFAALHASQASQLHNWSNLACEVWSNPAAVLLLVFVSAVTTDFSVFGQNAHRVKGKHL